MNRLFLALLLLLPFAVRAQSLPDNATLVADSVTLQSPTVLEAKGHVEVFFHGQHITASAITYDKAANQLQITGPIRIEDGKHELILADQADLSADLTEGMLISARIVMDQKLQLAASVVLRSDGGRYTAMRNVVASSCSICKTSATPLWEIRAREVVHDAVTQQIWFSGASFRFFGVPVLYLPIMRIPDPSLDRATGFLVPKLRSTSNLGTGVLTPYFIVLGRSRDVLVTPYLTTNGNATLNLRYRQAFTQGTLVVLGAVTHDNIRPGVRGYLQAYGTFSIGSGYVLAVNGITVSDPSYLSDYGISSADRLDSTMELSRVQRNLYLSAKATGFQTLRAGETTATQPAFLTDLDFHRRFLPAILGGEGEFEIQTHSQSRPSNVSTDTNGDGIADGRDMSRVTFKGDWRRNFTLDSGIEISTEAAAEADFYMIRQDNIYAGQPYRVTATTAVELRWPWVRAGKDGSSQMIEPVVQFVAAPKPDSAIPNEDSTLVEFDESNLFALDRFPGTDAFEAGARLNLGVNYLRTSDKGWTYGMTTGRVLRFDELGQFSAASGLSGARSDWMMALSASTPAGVSLTTRVLAADDLSLSKSELRFAVTKTNYAVSGGFEYLPADVAESRTAPVREVVLDGSYNVTGNWTARISDRYDLVSQRNAQAGLYVGFKNECLSADLSVSRTYASSTSVTPNTVFGLQVALLGFGGTGQQGPAQVCRR